MEFNFYATLVSLVFVLLLGRFIVSKVGFLSYYNIPEPVVGGVIVAIGLFIFAHYFGIKLTFDASLQEPLLLAFYASIGLSADFASLKKGGKILIVFLAVVLGLLIIQNIVGIILASLMGVNPLIGLLGGSITMSGGHGTGAAWAKVFEASPYHFGIADGVAMACATFGLIAGGIIGGPVAHYLMKRHKLDPKSHNKDFENVSENIFEEPTKVRLITATSFVESLALIAICLLCGTLIADLLHGSPFTIPTFVWCLFIGAALRNILSASRIHHVFDREMGVLGNVSLALFLAFALMNINILDLVSLALPMIVILVAQVVVMVLYAVFVTFRFCGKDYDACVLSAGHCGFGLGATPTAMVNMQAVTHHYGISHMAFVIVPLVGAFFVDILNSVVISGMLLLPVFPK